MTNGEFVSRFVNNINALKKDMHVSRRWILSMGRQTAESYIAQRWEDKSLFNKASLFKFVECIEMIQVDEIECKCLGLSFPRCNILMRSKYRIPGVLDSKYGPIILSVYNIGLDVKFRFQSLNDYNNNKDRQFGHIKSKTYYVLDGYIFIPDYPIEVVSAFILTLREDEVDEVFNCNGDVSCRSIWDYEFICPESIRPLVVRDMFNQISVKLQIPIDENPNMDVNLKSRTSQ